MAANGSLTLALGAPPPPPKKLLMSITYGYLVGILACILSHKKRVLSL